MKNPLLFFLLLLFFFAAPAQKSLITRLDSLSAAYYQQNFQGVVLVARGDSILYQHAFGYADIDKKIPLRTTTLFKTESTGKMYTAAAIMQLLEKGKLGLQQTLEELLPGLPVKNAGKITVHHLLTHRSGLQSPWDHAAFSFKKVYSREELEKIIIDLPLAFEEPGKEMYYSNSGYILLGWIVEKISGLDFDDYLATHIFQPLQMVSIRHLNDTLMPPGEAQPYRFLNSKKYIPFTQGIGPLASGAGGWIASARDLWRFMQGLDKGKIMSPQTRSIMFSANNSLPADSSFRFYAYGIENFVNQPIQGVSYLGHSGGGAGFSIDAILDPLTHTVIIFCSNTYTNPREISSNYMRMALGKPLAVIQKPNAIRIYDLISEIGISEFVKNEKKYFQQLEIKPGEWFFVNTGDAMMEAKDYSTLLSWLQLGATYFPGNGFIRLLQSDAYKSLGQKDQ
ncbi:MAG TPA: serine hydrolase domain-containing protein, partial [Chitinophagaceae bacterium]|nr:serine hydrolase domain-containing protein [Chitinophagaceae bacterium]